MNEIMISKKWVVEILVIIGLGAGVVWGVPKVLEFSQAEASTHQPRCPAMLWINRSHGFGHQVKGPPKLQGKYWRNCWVL